MAVVKSFAILVILNFFTTCDATTSSAQEETCTELHAKKELIQARNSLGAKKDGGEEEQEETEVKLANIQRSVACPWDMSNNDGCHEEKKAFVKCKDGTFPDDWTCEDRGGREKCPCEMPYMCAKKSCGKDGDEHCCETSCEKFDGLRPCHGKGLIPPKAEPTKAPRPAPRPTPAPKKCFTFHKSWSSVLGSAGISEHNRNTCIVYNYDRSSSSVSHFQGMNDEKNQGAAAAILTLQQNGYDVSQLKGMSEDDQRNTIIVETNKCKPNLSISHLQGLLTIDIAKEMNTGDCCPSR